MTQTTRHAPPASRVVGVRATGEDVADRANAINTNAPHTTRNTMTERTKPLKVGAHSRLPALMPTSVTWLRRSSGIESSFDTLVLPAE
jgi:hypothetical protein